MDGRLIIGNERLESANKLASENPATLESIGEACLASDTLCEEAVRAAKDAFPRWRKMPPAERAEILKRAEKILLRRSREAARLISMEKGSPYPESVSSEVFSVLQALNYYGENQEKLTKSVRARHHVPLLLNKRSLYQFHPLGPTLIISPWNFPFLIPFIDVLSSLSAGNTVILRPSETTPFCALLVGEVMIEAGLPPGVLNVVPSPIPQAERMIVHPAVQALMFTGSVAVGKRVMELASRNLTKLTLELGGKDPMIILKDADLDRAARGAVWGAYMNCGQSCGSIERVYVAKEIEEEFTARAVALTRKIRVGNPLEAGTDIGPMATRAQLGIVENHIADAREQGARIPFGGQRISSFPGHFIEPAVLTHVHHSMKIMTEETFGPVLPVMGVASPEEALELANDSIYGLTASVWTKNRKWADWFSDRLEAGTVTINDHMYSFIEPRAIWGGIKQTGMGRSHGVYGLQELVNIKYVSTDFLPKKSQLWWFPYDETLTQTLEKSLVLYHGSGLGDKIGALRSLLPALPRIKSTSPLLNYFKGLPRIFRK